ncbi:MAG: glycoside hydrolase family 27 protein [Solirubrobacterales bacterium]|nr:glycoside hydrolase family 27 protein [Solirubrobacterales bacterium]
MSSTADAGTTLAAKPYMGWTTYYGIGGQFNEHTILSVATRLRSDGLQAAGYDTVWLDWGWAGARRRHGQIVVNPYQWPHGMAWLTSTLHAEGFDVGIYTDAGKSGCNGNGVGSLGHYQQDMDQFAAWGFDAVKVDFCGAVQQGVSVVPRSDAFHADAASSTRSGCADMAAGDTRALPGTAHRTGEQLDPETQYREVAQAIGHTNRPMLLAVANLWQPSEVAPGYPTMQRSAFDNYRWAPQFATSWRTDTDIGFPGCIKWPWVLRNLAADNAHPTVAGPGHWNDPDALAAGVGLTHAQARSQLTMWSMLAAPLMLGGNPLTMSARTVRMLENPRIIAVDQDGRGVQGREVAPHVWVKPLEHGEAIAFFNAGNRPLTLAWRVSGRACNVWTGTCRPVRKMLRARVPGSTAEAWVVTG